LQNSIIRRAFKYGRRHAVVLEEGLTFPVWLSPFRVTIEPDLFIKRTRDRSRLFAEQQRFNSISMVHALRIVRWVIGALQRSSRSPGKRPDSRAKPRRIDVHAPAFQDLGPDQFVETESGDKGRPAPAAQVEASAQLGGVWGWPTTATVPLPGAGWWCSPNRLSLKAKLHCARRLKVYNDLLYKDCGG
jgi:hypothetical protein